jgi:hypothetical protein
MSTQNLPYIVIVNNPSGTPTDTAEVSGADAVFKDGTGTEVYRFKTSKGIDSELKFGLIERVKTGLFTVASVSAGDEFSFIISQYTDEVGGDGLIQVKALYTASAGDTVTDVASALKDVINANVQLKVTAANVAGVLILTADTGYPLYTISTPSNALGSFTEGTGTAVSPTGNSTTDELTTLTFAASVPVLPGDTIRASGFGGNNNDFVVQAVAGNTVVIFANLSEAPVGTAGDIIVLAQDKRFDSNVLIADGVEASFQRDLNGIPVQLEANETYLEASYSFMAPKGYGGFNNQTSDQEHLLKVYVKQTDADIDHAVDGLKRVIAAI